MGLGTGGVEGCDAPDPSLYDRSRTFEWQAAGQADSDSMDIYTYTMYIRKCSAFEQ